MAAHRQGNCSKSKKVIASEALKDPKTKNYVVEMTGRELVKEVKVMASDGAHSILQSQNPSHLKEFSWNMLLNEVSQFAPVLRSLLFSATHTRVPRINTDATVGMCVAMLVNNRNPKMNLVQKINSLLLYAAYTYKQVYVDKNLSNYMASSHTCTCVFSFWMLMHDSCIHVDLPVI